MADENKNIKVDPQVVKRQLRMDRAQSRKDVGGEEEETGYEMEDVYNQSNRLDEMGQRQAKKDLVKSVAKDKAKAVTKKAGKQAVKALWKRLIVPILSFLGSVAATVLPWILAFLVVIVLLAIILSYSCEAVRHFGFIGEQISLHFGVECPIEE